MSCLSWRRATSEVTTPGTRSSPRMATRGAGDGRRCRHMPPLPGIFPDRTAPIGAARRRRHRDQDGAMGHVLPAAVCHPRFGGDFYISNGPAIDPARPSSPRPLSQNGTGT